MLKVYEFCYVLGEKEMLSNHRKTLRRSAGTVGVPQRLQHFLVP